MKSLLGGAVIGAAVVIALWLSPVGLIFALALVALAYFVFFRGRAA